MLNNTQSLLDWGLCGIRVTSSAVFNQRPDGRVHHGKLNTCEAEDCVQNLTGNRDNSGQDFGERGLWALMRTRHLPHQLGHC